MTESPLASREAALRIALAARALNGLDVKAFVGAINRNKPTGVKGVYIKKVSLSSTMGPGVKLELGSVASL